MRFLALLLFCAAAVTRADPPAVAPIQESEKAPGYGVVESVSEIRLLPGERSAAAGGSAPSPDQGKPAYRVKVRMADGSIQYRDLHKPEFHAGQNVLLTNAGEILRD
jgi:hypothetical protein